MLKSSSSRQLSTTGVVSLTGLVLGVASLVVSMAVISGFYTTLRQNVIDVGGHIQIYKLDPKPEPWQNFYDKIKSLEPSVQAASRFAIIEGVIAHHGKVAGVFVQGVDQNEFSKVTALQNRLISGEFKFSANEASPTVLLGKGIAKNMGLQVGDEFRLVVPVSNDLEVTKFHRRVGVFKVAGILDLGKYEYDQRWIFTSLTAAQNLAEIGSRYSGLLVKLEDVERAREVATRLSRQLGSSFRIRDWRDVNENLFSAVDIEKFVLFLVIFVIVLAAAFNVASSLYISVVQSTPDIAILKALGLPRKKLARIFTLQGLLLGAFGAFLGMLLGFLLCWGFMFLQNEFGIIQASVYKIDRIEVQVRWADLLLIFSATLLICGIATWAPAKRAADLSTVEGLRQE